MKFISCAEIQQRYRIGRTTVYRWIDDPCISFPAPLKFGHRILWREDDLDAFDARVAEASEATTQTNTTV